MVAAIVTASATAIIIHITVTTLPRSSSPLLPQPPPPSTIDWLLRVFGKYHDHPIRRVSIFSNEQFEDLLILTTDCRVDHSDLSIHRCRSWTYDFFFDSSLASFKNCF
ncbi:hypothetical protein ABFS82_08G198700 [Erythranthe guttata]